MTEHVTEHPETAEHMSLHPDTTEHPCKSVLHAHTAEHVGEQPDICGGHVKFFVEAPGRGDHAMTA